MKLLPKSVINTELANQKKKQIDEGLLIARKIDALRITLLSLEKQQKDFISGMKDEVNKELKSLIDKLASTKIEIQDLEDKRKLLLLPLTKEWNEVNEQRKQIKEKGEQLIKEQIIIRKDKGVLESRLKKEKETVFKINTIKNEIAKVLKKTEDNEIETQKALKLAEVTRDRTIKECAERTQAINTKDAGVAIRERENQMLKESLELDIKFISEEKVRLADQRNTLERAMARINKK